MGKSETQPFTKLDRVLASPPRGDGKILGGIVSGTIEDQDVPDESVAALFEAEKTSAVDKLIARGILSPLDALPKSNKRR